MGNAALCIFKNTVLTSFRTFCEQILKPAWMSQRASGPADRPSTDTG